MLRSSAWRVSIKAVTAQVRCRSEQSEKGSECVVSMKERGEIKRWCFGRLSSGCWRGIRERMRERDNEPMSKGL